MTHRCTFKDVYYINLSVVLCQYKTSMDMQFVLYSSWSLKSQFPSFTVFGFQITQLQLVVYEMKHNKPLRYGGSLPADMYTKMTVIIAMSKTEKDGFITNMCSTGSVMS